MFALCLWLSNGEFVRTSIEAKEVVTFNEWIDPALHQVVTERAKEIDGRFIIRDHVVAYSISKEAD